MKNLRVFIVSLFVLVTSSIYGVSSFVEVSVGGGWSSLGYELDNSAQPSLSVHQNGSYGLNAHIGYGLQFTRLIGVGIGIDISRYGGTGVINGNAIWQGVNDTEGEAYNHITAVDHWIDKQNMLLLEIPLSIYLRFPIAHYVRLYVQPGVKACIPIKSSGSYSGSLRHMGEYEAWGLTISDVPNHGFYSSAMEGKYDLQPQVAIAAFLKIGIEGALDKSHNVWLYGALYGSFHCMPAFKTASEASSIGWRNDTQEKEMYNAHYFMSDYTPIINTDLMRGKPIPMAVGAEIGLRFRFPHIKPRRCMCEEE